MWCPVCCGFLVSCGGWPSGLSFSVGNPGEFSSVVDHLLLSAVILIYAYLPGLRRHDKNSIHLNPVERIWKTWNMLWMNNSWFMHIHAIFMRYEHLDFFVIHCCSHCYPERWRTFSGARQAKRSVAIARWNDWGENRGIQLATALTPVKHGLHVATPHMKISSKSVRFEGSSTLLQASAQSHWSPMKSHEFIFGSMLHLWILGLPFCACGVENVFDHCHSMVWINTYRYIFSGMNIHLPAILMFTRGTRFWHTAICWQSGSLACFASEFPEVVVTRFGMSWYTYIYIYHVINYIYMHYIFCNWRNNEITGRSIRV